MCSSRAAGPVRELKSMLVDTGKMRQAEARKFEGQFTKEDQFVLKSMNSDIYSIEAMYRDD